jgi:LuxR family maltose regulon positive regulatory protein
MVALRSGLQMSRGRLGEAEQLLSNSFDELLRGEFVKPSAVVHISAQMAAIFYRRNQLQEALEEAEKCIRYAEPQQANQSLLDAYTIKALALQAHGKPRQASAMIEEAQIIAAATAAPLRERGVNFAAINLALLQGDTEFLVDWATAQHIDSSQPYSPTWEQTILLLGRFLLRQGEFQRARDLIALLKPRAEKRIQFEACLVADLIESAALKGLGQEDQARATLEGAIERAATEGYVQAFVEDAHCLHELLLSLRKSKNGPVRLYLPTLLKACHAVIEPSTSRRRVELEHGQELTPRETEILQLIAVGMSNKEIAAAAFVSLSTVKTHINHIFQKLEVGNREQMISSARALEII